MERNHSIELLRVVSIFFIVIIHCKFDSYLGSAIDAIARFAVPIFFMITGYFIIQPNNMTAKLKKQMIRLALYYIIYQSIYTLYYFIIALLEGKLSDFQKDFITNIERIVISPIFGIQLWYIINMIWVLMIIYVFYYFNKLKLLFVSSIILHLIGIMISHLSFQFLNRTLPLCATRNFLFYGLFYVMLGSYIRKIDIRKIKINNSLLLALAILLCLCQVAEKYLYTTLFGSTFGDYFISTIFASSMIFIFTLRSFVNNKTIKKMSSFSMPIFYLHMLVIDILVRLNNHILHTNLRENLIGNFLFIIVVCMFSCILYNVFKKILLLLFYKEKKPIKVTVSQNL